jgi:hypothetical protein
MHTQLNEASEMTDIELVVYDWDRFGENDEVCMYMCMRVCMGVVYVWKACMYVYMYVCM